MRIESIAAWWSLALVLGLRPATALDPHTRITQYFHTAWRVQDGAFEAAPNAVAQTADGYIWIGTGSGLVKYDGARFDPWAPPPGKSLPDPNVISLRGSSDGTLWIGTARGLYQIRREFNAQVDGRVDERLRVARELHDTLLQSFQASLIRMQAARNIFDRRPEKAVQSLDDAITMAAGAVAEGRDAIQDLRAKPSSEGDLAQLLTAAGQELAHSEEAPANPSVFRLTVEGERRDLEPLLQDEVYRIARELLRNAVRHAQAGHIEAEIRYESRQLSVHVCDDGKGIDPEVLKAGGRAGHWGLPGIGVLERSGGGTEAVLTVPASAAYGVSNSGRFSFFRKEKAGT